VVTLRGGLGSAQLLEAVTVCRPCGSLSPATALPSFDTSTSKQVCVRS
jgi:hypothetical protein